MFMSAVWYQDKCINDSRENICKVMQRQEQQATLCYTGGGGVRSREDFYDFSFDMCVCVSPASCLHLVTCSRITCSQAYCMVNAKSMACIQESIFNTLLQSDSPDFRGFWSWFHLAEFTARIIHDMQPWSQVKTVLKRQEIRTFIQKSVPSRSTVLILFSAQFDLITHTHILA